MSQQIGGYPPPPASGASGAPAGQSTTQVARDEAQDVGRTAAGAGRQVAGTAAEQAGQVAQEVKTQARDLVGEVRGQVQGQARNGQQKAVEGVRALSQELRQMADSGQSGTVSEVARQAAGRVDDLAAWLGDREPAELLDEVRLFARRRPGVFLASMALAGVIVGRLTRGAVDSARSDTAQSRPLPVDRAYPRTPAAPARTYDEPGRLASDSPTPPRGLTRPYAPEPVAPASPGPAHQADPFSTAEPGGRHATVGDYADDLARERRDPGAGDPFRPGESR